MQATDFRIQPQIPSGPILRVPDDGTLELEFVNWKEELVSLVFHDVLGLRYHSTVCDEFGESEDTAIEVIESLWLQESCEVEGFDPSQFRHLVVGFNERSMVLEVLFRSINEKR